MGALGSGEAGRPAGGILLQALDITIYGHITLDSAPYYHIWTYNPRFCSLQVLRYQNGEHYHAHHDFFDPKDYANDPYWSSLAAGGARNRMATLFMYLSDVEAGGETILTRI